MDAILGLSFLLALLFHPLSWFTHGRLVFRCLWAHPIQYLLRTYAKHLLACSGDIVSLTEGCGAFAMMNKSSDADFYLRPRMSPFLKYYRVVFVRDMGQRQ